MRDSSLILLIQFGSQVIKHLPKANEKLKQDLIGEFPGLIRTMSYNKNYAFPLHAQSANMISGNLVSSGHRAKRGYQLSSFNKVPLSP